jgi:hypothetical protein
MTNLFEYEKEAIRIKARRVDLEKEEFRQGEISFLEQRGVRIITCLDRYHTLFHIFFT